MITDTEHLWERIPLPPHILDLLKKCQSYTVPKNRKNLFELAMGGKTEGIFEVAYDVPGRGRFVEATVTKCKNGLSINYTEPYMRRRDPHCMVVADNQPTDKNTFAERFGKPFEPVRQETFEWLALQRLVVMPFIPGGVEANAKRGALLIAPDNAGFFIGGLADLQGIISIENLPDDFRVCSLIYLAPTFRHTHFDNKQLVVHNRLNGLHEVFSYNLYPGPSAKKGVYGVLLAQGEKEEWPTLHASTVQVVTPYDNITTIMHEGASGSGKSEMLQYAHRQADGRLMLGRNIVTGEERYLVLNQGCALHPVTDDMAVCKPIKQNNNGYIVAGDAEQAWFIRLNHIDKYGTDPYTEAITVNPSEPLIFLNLQGVSSASCLIWEHTEDKPGLPCPNPRVILPRHLMPDIVNGTVEVQIRNFGIRTPPCTKNQPTYGIVGFMHLLPAALAWLWRLVAPRGYSNPSITDNEGMASEGVGSYWPFATGRIVDHANLLLRQIQNTPKVRYTLTPNQYVGAWDTGFVPQWIAREYLARKGAAKFLPRQVQPARCPLLGYALNSIQIEGTPLHELFLRVDRQPEVGVDGYDAGAKILQDFFHRELEKFLCPDLDTLGSKIINCCLNNCSVEDYERLLYSTT
ncbi:MAG TPA: DUF4914 domain-containing protein [Phycisphaerales bacterium]|nr:DUF4914 domain-containing protein [Phycisphaerales bacterium]